MNKDELPEYAKALIYRAIATKLQITRDHLVSSLEAQAKVDRCLLTVKAIADNKTLNGAVDNLLKIYSGCGEIISRRAIVKDVNQCYEKFNTEIASIESMLDMNRRNMEPKDIWDFLRSRVPIGSEYEDDWLQAADAWILRGENRAPVIGTGILYSFSNPEDEGAFVREIIEMQAPKRKNPKAKY
jgi:hypothetical protein